MRADALGLCLPGLLLAALWGCGAPPRTEVPPTGLPPVLELAAESRALRMGPGAPRPAGPGAEALPGDILLENAVARFVVASAERTGGDGPAGCLLDAALQGGEDRMRRLCALLGAPTRSRPVYRRVTIEEVGGLGKDAVAVAEGHMCGAPDVRVRTVYRLPPDSLALRVKTTVENNSGRGLRQFDFADVLCHGRTFRFAPGAGVFPTGRSASSRWMAFFHGDFTWGLVTDAEEPFTGEHGAGESVLHYASVDIPPGETASYSRRVRVAFGGPLALWRALYSSEKRTEGRLEIAFRDIATGRPVRPVLVEFTPLDGRSPFVTLQEEGKAELRLPSGDYRAVARSPGRAPLGPVPLSIAGGARHVVELKLSPPAEVVVTVRSTDEGSPRPAWGRVEARRLEAGELRSKGGPPFESPWSAVALTEGLAEETVPLEGGRTKRRRRYLLSASKGPLYDCPTARVPAVPGETLSFSPVLKQVADPGAYVAVDFRQHTDASPDSPLGLSERAALNASEGLQGSVLADSTWVGGGGAPIPFADGAMVPARRFRRRTVGSFTIFPVRQDPERWAEFARTTFGNPSGGDILQTLRQLFPGSFIQINSPLDERWGFLASGGDLTGMPFDALEILSGTNVAAARRLLPRWFECLNAGRRIVATGGSGSRALRGVRAGVARTWVHCPSAGDVPSAGELQEALLRLKDEPNAVVTNGPFIEATLGGETVGSLQTVEEDTVRLELRVLCAPWVDASWGRIYRNGELVKEFAIPPASRPVRAERSFDLRIDGDCWFVVEVQGEKPMHPVYVGEDSPTPWAVTNPFWVDADGDGLVRPD